MAYYNPDAILIEAQKVPLTFELAVPQLTALNNGSAVEQGTKLDLPLWMAEMLAVSKPAGPQSNPLGSLDLPTALGPRVMNALRADPKSVDLRAQAQFFYGLGERMLELFEEEETVEVLTDTFKKRAIEIADKSQHTRAAQQGDGSNEFLSSLDESERMLFRAAHDGSLAVRRWFENAS